MFALQVDNIKELRFQMVVDIFITFLKNILQQDSLKKENYKMDFIFQKKGNIIMDNLLKEIQMDQAVTLS